METGKLPLIAFSRAFDKAIAAFNYMAGGPANLPMSRVILFF